MTFAMMKTILPAAAILGISSAAMGVTFGFVEPSAVPVEFGPNHYEWQLGNGPGNVYGIESGGSPDVTATADLWSVGDQNTTKQVWSQLSASTPYLISSRVVGTSEFVQDGSASLSQPKLTVRAPGFNSSSGLYSFAGDYSAVIDVANYGGTTNSRAGGTLVLLQIGAGPNPDLIHNFDDQGRGHAVGSPTDSYSAGYDPHNIVIKGAGGAALASPAEVLGVDVVFQSHSAATLFGEVQWQELLWTIWVPDYTGDLQIDFGVAVHSSLTDVRLDTAIGSINSARELSSFQVVPEPASLSLLGLGAVAMLRRRRR